MVFSGEEETALQRRQNGGVGGSALSNGDTVATSASHPFDVHQVVTAGGIMGVQDAESVSQLMSYHGLVAAVALTIGILRIAWVNRDDHVFVVEETAPCPTVGHGGQFDGPRYVPLRRVVDREVGKVCAWVYPER